MYKALAVAIGALALSLPGSAEAPPEASNPTQRIETLPPATPQRVETLPPATPQRVETLPPATPHRVWVSDLLLSHSLLFDGDTGEVLATVDAGVTISPKPPLYSAARKEFYSVEIDYSRGRRGERVDYVTIYDDRTLEVTGEVVIPTRTSESATSIAYAALLDGDRFLATFNQFPQVSVSVTDLESRSFVGEIPIGGCAGIYPLSGLRFLTLCGNGTVLVVTLDESGRLLSTLESEPFFDAVEDPVMMAGVRLGDRWLYTSFEGTLFDVDASGSAPSVSSWSLLSDSDAADGWRPGGKQHLSLHRESGRLYGVFHQGGSGTHKDAGPEVWVHDLSTQQRVERLEMPNFAAAFLATTLGIESGGFVEWLLHAVIPGGGAHSVAVTQDASPLLFARNNEMGVVAVLDARTGAHLRNLDEVGLAGSRLEVPN